MKTELVPEKEFSTAHELRQSRRMIQQEAERRLERVLPRTRARHTL